MTEIDDLRLVMDEAAVMLLDRSANGDRLVVTYSVGTDSVAIDARVVSDAGVAIPDEGVERFSELVGDLIDSYTIDPDERRLVLNKRRAS